MKGDGTFLGGFVEFGIFLGICYGWGCFPSVRCCAG